MINATQFPSELSHHDNFLEPMPIGMFATSEMLIPFIGR